ncbi:MAG: hypothetical protein K2L10_04450 [Ruminococcus sp.]|nr:hypothetical protein [Ruminococcus sp.]
MSRLRSKITALPSLVICKDGTEKELKSLSEKDKNEFRLLMCFNISKTMSEYYSLHNTEWETFLHNK